MKKIIFVSLITIFLTFFTFYLSSFILPYKGFFPYKGVAKEYSNNFLTKLANFDGVHYLKIARNGYDQYEQAFFPLYPLLIKFFSPFFLGNLLYAAIFLSNASLILGIGLFYKVLKRFLDKEKSFWTILLFLFSPTGFFLSSVYTESLFLLLFFAGFYFLEKKRSKESFLFFYLLGLTRVVGVLASPAIVLYQKGKKGSFYLALAPLLGLLTYMFYLYRTTGDPFFFFTSQPAFGANRSTTPIFLPQVYYRYFKIFFTADFSFAYFVALLEILFFSIVFFVLCFYAWKLFKKKKLLGREAGFLFFSIFSLILPTLTGTFSSIPRYSLLAFSFFIFLGKVENRSFKILTLIIFIVLRIVLNLFFAQGYFIS